MAGHGKISIPNGIMGLYPSRGEVKLYGEPIDVTKTSETLDKGVAFVSEDRRGVGLMLDESIELNITIAAMKTKNRFVVKRFGCAAGEKPFRRKPAKGLHCAGVDAGAQYSLHFGADARH